MKLVIALILASNVAACSTSAGMVKGLGEDIAAHAARSLVYIRTYFIWHTSCRRATETRCVRASNAS
jgi:predicted small secreted protein